MIKKAHLLLFSLLSLISVSCNDWLTLDPKSETTGDALFETPKGFEAAMNGIYIQLAGSSLYGQNLKFGMLDVLAQCYDLSSYTVYEEFENYHYENVSAKSTILSIWSNAYNTIANCNSLLTHLEQRDSSFFESHGHDILEGEALAVRALLHFDLVRLFAPAPVVKDSMAIPYFTQVSNKPQSPILTSEVLRQCMTDLKRAKACLKAFDNSDETRKNFTAEYRFYTNTGFFGTGDRGFHLNYYAVTALLAKVAQYAGDNATAIENAQELLDQPDLLDLTPSQKIDNGKYDRLLSEDILFAVWQEDLEKRFSGVMMLVKNVTEGLFKTDLDDFRKKCYLEVSGDRYKLKKYILTEDSDLEKNITGSVPMFRLSEMYYILSEALYDTRPQEAIELIKTLRTKRGCTSELAAISSKEDLLQVIINDSRREFTGEGQLFYLYKRLNHPVLDELGGDRTLTYEFTLPIPERENSYSN